MRRPYPYPSFDELMTELDEPAPVGVDSAIFRVAVAVSMGRTLLAPRASVGPYRRATDPSDEVRFACIDEVTKGPVPCVQVEPYFVQMPWGFERETRYLDDWSAFAAARAFVEIAGVAAAEEALAR